jgi:purine-nucleoside/S-methyl-5'-thioadenosine phosphorylase / adenosine deaminase
VDDEFAWVDGAAGRALQSTALAAVASHLFTSRVRSFRGAAEADDWRHVAVSLHVEPAQLIRVRQVHGRAVLIVRPGEPVSESRDADAVVLLDPARAASVRVADCVPILIADRGRRVVAAVHAGWRGTCAGVAAAAVGEIRELGIAPADLVAALGPSIGPCCYQVDDRVRLAFLGMTPDAAHWFTEDGPGRWKLDLWAANADQLQDAGIPPGAIHAANLCTAEHLDDCFSYRAEGPGTGRMVAAIKLRT